jgi:hypothetical protein
VAAGKFGNTTFSAIGIGAVLSVGTQGAGITGIYSSVVSVTPGQVTASRQTTAQVTVTGAATNDTVIATPYSTWSGTYLALTWTATVTAANTVDIAFSNASGNNITPDAQNWRVTVIGF